MRWIACDEPSLVRIDRYTPKTSLRYAISLVLCECSLSLLTHFTPSAHSLTHSLTLFPSPLLSSGLTNYHSLIPFFFLLLSLSSPLCDCVCVFVRIPLPVYTKNWVTRSPADWGEWVDWVYINTPDVLTIYYNLNQGSTFITTLDCDKLFIWSRWQNPWAKMRSGR